MFGYIEVCISSYAQKGFNETDITASKIRKHPIGTQAYCALGIVGLHGSGRRGCKALEQGALADHRKDSINKQPPPHGQTS
jgi:hypothetical protein